MTGFANRGYSLIETMLALVLVATGMLGSAAFLNRSLGAMRAAQLQSAAIALASDLAGRMRANAAHADAFEDPLAVCQDTRPGFCGEADAARAAMTQWQAQAERMLPGASVRVAPAAGDVADTYLIALTWSTPGTEAGAHSLLVTLNAPER